MYNVILNYYPKIMLDKSLIHKKLSKFYKLYWLKNNNVLNNEIILDLKEI